VVLSRQGWQSFRILDTTMKGRTKMKNQNITFTLAILFMNCFGVFAPKTFGVTPTPDGCIQGSPRRKDVARFKISPAELQIRELAIRD
jgi:hypothetical protein